MPDTQATWKKRPTRWTLHRVVVLVTVLAMCVAIGVLLACALYAGPREYNGGVGDEGGGIGKIVLPAHISRPIYRYSVVPGGFGDPAELRQVADKDYVVHALYNGINFPLVHEHRLKEDTLVYVSYRIGQQVFWTQKPHWIMEGDKTFTDGREMVRARCGNLLSLTPRFPTRGVEPSIAVLNEVLTMRDPGSTVTPMLHSSLTVTAPTVPGFVIGTPGGWGGRPCKHEDDGDSDDCKHKHTPPPAPVPEPETWALVGIGLVGVYAYTQRRKHETARA